MAAGLSTRALQIFLYGCRLQRHTDVPDTVVVRSVHRFDATQNVCLAERWVRTRYYYTLCESVRPDLHLMPPTSMEERRHAASLLMCWNEVGLVERLRWYARAGLCGLFSAQLDPLLSTWALIAGCGDLCERATMQTQAWLSCQSEGGLNARAWAAEGFTYILTQQAQTPPLPLSPTTVAPSTEPLVIDEDPTPTASEPEIIEVHVTPSSSHPCGKTFIKQRIAKMNRQ